MYRFTLPRRFAGTEFAQALTATPTDDDVGRGCFKLQTIRSDHATLPSSYNVLDELARAGDDPIALGAVVDVWGGTYHDKEVSIKTLRYRWRMVRRSGRFVFGIVIPTAPAHECESIRGPSRSHSSSRRGCGAEKAKSPEHHAFYWYYDGSFASCFGGYAEGDLMEYLEENSEVNRIGLVSSSSFLLV